MKKGFSYFFSTLLCCTLLFLLLFYSDQCIKLASNGLLLWYRNMIPSLFPFMVLSGFMIRSGLSFKLGQWLRPLLGSLFHLSPSMLYAIFMGFLCGFPMGAKMVADLLEKEQITLKEGEYLLAFCNNIGPLYMLGYVIPLFGYENAWIILGFMYLVPLGYGLFLRYFSTKYFSKSKLLTACSYSKENSVSSSYLICFQQSLSSAIEQITLLGGCMVFFNCLLIFPNLLKTFLLQTLNNSDSLCFFSAILSSLIEIGGGLQQLSSSSLWHLSPSTSLPLGLLTFGGLSCIAQTCFILKNTGLKISTYIKHKLIQTCIFLIFIFIL